MPSTSTRRRPSRSNPSPNAIDAAGGKPTRAQVVEAMANVEITSITGTFQFDEKGDNINAKAYAYEIVDGYPGKLVGELTGA